ncbi:MAG TPA: hypothetical protein VG820_12455 [Fimbriimonadaceae bacterium]|nr:hypothetical protein [Fimbriimonadaceae bacterium]
MISCPKCNATLPDWAQTCQFCQTDVKAVPRSKAVAPQKKGWTPAAPWIWPCYYAMCAFFVLEGLGGIIQTLLGSHHKIMGQEVGLDVMSYVSMAIDGFTILIGIGLALRVEIIRGIVNFFCGLRILFGIIDLGFALLGSLLVGALGFVFVILNLVNIASAGFMIYLIGETDKHAPNL